MGERRAVAGRSALLLLGWLALTGALVGVGDLVVHSSWVNSFDRHVTSVAVAHRSPGLDAIMKAVTWLGSWVAVVVTAVMVGFLVARRRLPVTFLLLAVVAWGGTQGATTLAKNIVQRSRPPEHLRLVSAHGWAWPSGHAATAALVFTVLFAMVWSLVPGTAVTLVAAASAIVAIAAVACSRVFLGVHWTTDVVAGIAFVGAWLVSLAVLLGGMLGVWSHGTGPPAEAGRWSPADADGH